eukprot:jgi/Tetstr1/447242/TSEL_034679.t1
MKTFERSLGVRPSASTSGFSRKVKKGKGRGKAQALNDTQLNELKCLMNSGVMSLYHAKKEAHQVTKTFQDLYDMVSDIYPGHNRGLVFSKYAQKAWLMHMIANPNGAKDPIIWYVYRNGSKVLLDGIQRLLSILGAREGDLSLPINEEEIARECGITLDDDDKRKPENKRSERDEDMRDRDDGTVSGDEEDEDDGSDQGTDGDGSDQDTNVDLWTLLFLEDIDNKHLPFYDLSRDRDDVRWTPSRGVAKRKAQEANVNAWKEIYAHKPKAYQVDKQDESSLYVSGAVADLIMDLTLPVTELREIDGWTLEDASEYVAQMMSNREPLPPHEVCMILVTESVSLLKGLASDEVCSMFMDKNDIGNVRNTSFALVLSAALLFKESEWAPGADPTCNALLVATKELVLTQGDVEAMKQGFLRLIGLAKNIPRVTIQRAALAIAFASKHSDFPVDRVWNFMKESVRSLRDRDSTACEKFKEGLVDNLANSYIAMKNFLGVTDGTEVYNEFKNDGDKCVIDLTGDSDGDTPR